MTTPLPEQFTLSHYRLTLEALEPLQLPPFKGSTLRGGFGYTFQRLACLESWACGKKCQRGNACAYGYVFDTTPPADTNLLSGYSDIPRPFVIQPPTDMRTRIPRGDLLTFGLTLIGAGQDYLAHFVAVFRELGQVGLGRTNGKYRLMLVEAVPLYDAGLSTVVYSAANETIQRADASIDATVLRQRADHLSPDTVAVEFVAPARLKHQGQWVRRGPSFQAFIKTLLGRVSSLSYFHCGEQFETDFRGLIDRAAAIETHEARTRWEDWSRVSGHQQREVKLGGLVGRVTYRGEVQPYLPLLVLGEAVHIGKGTVFGNGQYRILA